MTFYMPIPASLSRKKQLELIGKFHTKKPDIDNIIKGLFDAINGLCWKDDNQVCRLTASKVYDEDPRIEFEVIEI
jgi:Holliday junction resolvase RusA-like endonuclease